MIAAVCGWVGYAVYGEAGSSRSLDGQVQQYQSENAALKQDIAQRQREIDQAHSRAWLVEEARKLGYVMPGEQVFILVTPGVALPPDGGIDFKNLPTYSPTPGTTPTASPSAKPVVVATPGSPTPFVFHLGSPTPRP